MPSRLRLFVKKRGTRRTGPRWTGMIAEALLFLALIVAGAYGLYWLIGSVLLAEGSRHGIWLWFAVVIPLALLGYGIMGLSLLLWQSAASSERRAAAVRKATDWELPAGLSKPGQISLPGIPSYHTVTDSPGVRLAYRLPPDAAKGWISFTMAAVCVVWNTLVAIFVYHVVQQHLNEDPNRWLLTWLIVPFVIASGWTLAALIRQVVLDIIMGTTRVEVSDHPFYPGGRFQGRVSQTGRSHVRWYEVKLVCDEQAVYQQGTDTRQASNRVQDIPLFKQRKFDITPRETFEAEFDVPVPASAMHSFVAGHNAILWSIVVSGRMARWGEFERRFPVFIYPVRTNSPVTVAASAPLESGSR